MLLAAIVIWLMFAFVFWCVLAGAARGDALLEAAHDRAMGTVGERRTALVETPPAETEPLSHAA